MALLCVVCECHDEKKMIAGLKLVILPETNSSSHVVIQFAIWGN